MMRHGEADPSVRRRCLLVVLERRGLLSAEQTVELEDFRAIDRERDRERAARMTFAIVGEIEVAR